MNNYISCDSCGTIGKGVNLCVRCRMKSDEYTRKEARKGYIKLEDVERILKENTIHNSYMTVLIAYGALEEIKKLDNKKVTLEDVMLAEQLKNNGG